VIKITCESTGAPSFPKLDDASPFRSHEPLVALSGLLLFQSVPERPGRSESVSVLFDEH
jgi:hypothetical protein